MHLVITMSLVILHVNYDDCCYAGCHSADCHCADFQYGITVIVIMLSVIILCDVMLNVSAPCDAYLELAPATAIRFDIGATTISLKTFNMAMRILSIQHLYADICCNSYC